MPSSNLPEAATAVAAVVATAASVFLAGPPATPAANAATTLPALATASSLEDEQDFAVDDAAFMAPTGSGVLRVASFNMLHVGQRAAKDFDRLARIVQQFDLCGVLELENEQGLRDLTAALGSDWRHVISDREAGDRTRSGTFEFYGFVFRSSKVTPLDSPTGFFPDPDEDFSREPFFASFRSGQFDFTMILLHAESPGNSANLTRELQHLPDVFAHVQDLDPTENDVILAGDFNRSPTTDAGNPASAWTGFLSMPNMDCVIPDAQLTSLSTKPRGFANHYDEICLARDATREFTGTQGAFDFVAALFEGENKPAMKFVSDHLPVWVEFRTDLPDDDGGAAPGTPQPADPAECCKICRTSKPCGDACIPRDLNCSRPAGCACGETH
jgi:endonuclease/exonuclease/phosphatase family metal-dependent hydrolase